LVDLYAVTPVARYADEWTFELDAAGQSLRDAMNSGTNSPLAQFSAGSANVVFTTNRTLLCVGNHSGADGVWTNGAMLDASLISVSRLFKRPPNYTLRGVGNLIR
jgi:hypothetical protein